LAYPSLVDDFKLRFRHGPFELFDEWACILVRTTKSTHQTVFFAASATAPQGNLGYNTKGNFKKIHGPSDQKEKKNQAGGGSMSRLKG
jgi:hypothetical protein